MLSSVVHNKPKAVSSMVKIIEQYLSSAETISREMLDLVLMPLLNKVCCAVCSSIALIPSYVSGIVLCVLVCCDCSVDLYVVEEPCCI